MSDTSNSALKNVLVRRFKKQGLEISDKVVSVNKPPVEEVMSTQPPVDLHAVNLVKQAVNHETAFRMRSNMTSWANVPTMAAVDSAITEKFGTVLPPQAQPTTSEETNKGYQVTKQKAFHIVKEGYLLCFDRGKVYFQLHKDVQKLNYGNVPSVPTILAHGEGSSTRISAPTMTRKKDGSREYVDKTSYVSKDEMLKVIENKPTVEELFKVYYQVRSDNKLVLDPDNVQPIW